MRKCGYCRHVGHTSSGCDIRLGQINQVQRHVGLQRRDISALMHENGLGIGAIVSAYYYGDGEFHPCLVTQDSLDSAFTDGNNTHEFYNIRYSKAVRMQLYSVSGNFVESKVDDQYYNNITRSDFSFRVVPLDINETYLRASFHISDLPKGPNNNPSSTLDKSRGWYSRYSTLLSPSEDGEPSAVARCSEFYLHDRLDKKNRRVFPIF